MKLQSELEEVKLELSNAQNAVKISEQEMDKRLKAKGDVSKEMEDLRGENLALRNDISLLKNKMNN